MVKLFLIKKTIKKLNQNILEAKLLIGFRLNELKNRIITHFILKVIWYIKNLITFVLVGPNGSGK